MDVTKVRSAYVFSWGIVGLSVVATVTGLLSPGVYRDVAWIRATWFGNDLVTLLVAVPLMSASLVAARRGSRLGELLWYSMLGYTVYNYEYYLHGARINELFPVYVGLVIAPMFALAMALYRADVDAIARSFSPRTPVRVVAAYLGFTGVGLGVAWLAQWAGLVFGGTVPSIGEGPFQLVASLDLTFVVPLMIVSAALLWRRAKWGFVLGAIMAVKGMTYTLVLTAGSIVGAGRGIAGSAAQIPVWGVWTLVGAAAAAALLNGLRGSASRLSAEGSERTNHTSR